MTDTVDPVEKQSANGSDVMSAVDTIDSAAHLVIADVSRDDTWLAMDTGSAVSIQDWQ
jgi:hypothetical protein